MGKESDNVAAASSADRRSERKSPPAPKAAPWLVIPYGKGMRKNQAFYNICEPNNKTLRKCIPELSGKSFKQKTSHQGWCIMLCDEGDFDYSAQVWNFGDCFLWNPATLQTIELPSLLPWTNKEYVFVDCVLSSRSSTEDTADNKSMVLVLFERKDKRYDHVLLYCFPGDKRWRMQRLARDMVDFEDVATLWCFKDKFYVMGLSNRHLEIERQKLGDIVSFSIRPFEVADTNLWTSVGGRHSTVSSTYFVECGDELFRIVLTYPAREFMKVDVVALSVAKVDFSAMELKEVKSLGDHVLFLSNNNAISCSAADLGLSKGCLYYALEEDQGLHKFEVESNGNSVILPCLKLPMTWYTSGWILVQDKHRRKEDMFGKELKAVMDNRTNRTGNDKNGDQRETLTRGEVQGAAIPWNVLNADMVGLIAKNYLHRLDYIHFRLASKANRDVMPMVKLTSSCTTRCTDLSPWLVFSRDKCHDVYNFVNPMHNNENYLMHLPDLVGATIRFQKGGWLLMSKGLTSIFFYNPFTREKINLPDLPVDMYSFSGITFSSSPTSSDCIIFAIEQMPASDGMSNEIYIYFITRGAALWSICNFPNPNTEKFMPLHNTPVFYNGVFYCVDYNGTLGVFNLEDCSWKVLEKPPHQQFSGMYPSFLVECAGQILLVNLGHLGASVRVYRLDFLKMEWDVVGNLGKHMLFIGYTSCFSAIAPNRRMENKIYFPRLCLNGEGILFYSLETGNYHSFGIQHSANNFYDTEGWYTNCTWIEPNWSKAQVLDWLNPPL